jgi:hypothetical protein
MEPRPAVTVTGSAEEQQPAGSEAFTRVKLSVSSDGTRSLRPAR